jgi:FAD/FMN-containing dehydrogenase
MGLFTSRRALIAALAVGVPGAYLAHKGWLMSAAPLGDKDCGPDLGTASDSTVSAADGDLPWSARGGTVNDVSCLSRTAVSGVVKVSEERHVADALAYAGGIGVGVSIAGARHSMGGHAFARDGVVLDMTSFNNISLNEPDRTVTVQTGATWHDIQNAIHPRYAVKAMQSSDVFTVGGSISVNAHGMDHRIGAVERTIRKLRIMLADGSIVTAARDTNADLYRHVVGGYGLFGVVLEAELEITDNTIYRSERRLIDYADFPQVFDEDINANPEIELFYTHLSTAPDTFLREAILYTYHAAAPAQDALPPLGDVSAVWLRRLIFNLAKQGDVFRQMKWYLEREIEPMAESCTITRQDAQASGEGCFVSRNEPMHDSVPYLFNRLGNDTDILHEYFVPRDAIVPFIDGVRTIMETHQTNLLNASVRVVHKEDIALNYAPEEAFSLVLYINQSTDADGNARMRALTGDLVDLTHDHGGRFFLPYQLHYSPDQLRRAYPDIATFFAAKARYDPGGLLTNTWHSTYAPYVG